MDYCIKCKKPAVCFFPACDPDIPSSPYCRKCVEQVKKRILKKIESMEV